MFRTSLSLLVLSTLFLTAESGHAQDLNAMNAQFNAQMNAQMQATTQSIVQANMNNPHVWRMYQIYRQQGGTLNFPSYCFRYAETGGMTWEGTRRAMDASSEIHARDMQNFNHYADWSRQTKQSVYDYRNEVQDSWARQRGENLTARSTYVNGAQGSAWQLPNNASPGQVFQDQASGTMFWMDLQGQYWMNNGQGWQAMYYQK